MANTVETKRAERSGNGCIMTSVQEFIATNSTYLSEDDAASISQISAAAWPAVLDALEELNGASDPGIDCSIAITRETLADFESAKQNHWRECRRTTRHEFQGFATVKYEDVQLAKGAPRRDIIIIDAGEYRIVLN